MLSLGVLAAILRLGCFGQEVNPAHSSPVASPSAAAQDPDVASRQKDSERTFVGDSATPSISRPGIPPRAAGSRFSYYMEETYWNPSALTAPAFRASMRMASPPGKGATTYPNEWRQGTEAFGRNYGDAFAARISTHTAQFLTGMVTREAPWYTPSASRGFLARSSHALAFTFVDRSDSGRPLPALSNFAGAAAGGFIGNAYLPAGFRDATHAGQRASFQFGMLAAGNLFREFAPQMPAPLRTFLSLIAR
jgi:hypothetical protein